MLARRMRVWLAFAVSLGIVGCSDDTDELGCPAVRIGNAAFCPSDPETSTVDVSAAEDELWLTLEVATCTEYPSLTPLLLHRRVECTHVPNGGVCPWDGAGHDVPANGVAIGAGLDESRLTIGPRETHRGTVRFMHSDETELEATRAALRGNGPDARVTIRMLMTLQMVAPNGDVVGSDEVGQTIDLCLGCNEGRCPDE